MAAAPVASSSVTLSPSSGSGSSQTFTAQIVDSNGASTVSQVDLIIGTVGATNGCWVEYGGNTLYMRDDANNWMSASVGSGTVLQNSQCSLNTGASSASISGAGTQLTVNFAMSFTPVYAGAQPLVTFVADSTGWSTGFVTQGTYNVTAQPVVQPGISVALSPSSGSGSTAKFVLKTTDSGGYGAVQQVDLFIGNNLGGTNQCYLDYSPAARTLSLLSSDNSHWITSKVGTGTSIQNSVCSVRLNSVGVSGSGNTLTLTIAVNFSTSHYAGSQAVLTFAADGAGQSTGWHPSFVRFGGAGFIPRGASAPHGSNSGAQAPRGLKSALRQRKISFNGFVIHNTRIESSST